jgi:hypothetical protein
LPEAPQGELVMRCRALALAAVIATGAAGAAWADTLDIRKADNGVSLDLGAAYLDYGETFAGTTLDTEKGWLPTVGLGVGMLAFPNALIPNLYVHLDARASFGSTHYNGALCDAFGNCTPYQSTTDDAIATGALQLGRGFELGRSVMLTPFVELGYRYWGRDLTGIGGYYEDYSNWDAMGGLLAQLSPMPRWVLSFSGAAGSTFGANLKALGENFSLGSEPTWRLQAKAGYRVTERIELTATAEYQSLRYGASPIDANGFFEPDSTTHQTSLLIGAVWHFF